MPTAARQPRTGNGGLAIHATFGIRFRSLKCEVFQLKL
jgi:hypothetical protein